MTLNLTTHRKNWEGAIFFTCAHLRILILPMTPLVAGIFTTRRLSGSCLLSFNYTFLCVCLTFVVSWSVYYQLSIWWSLVVLVHGLEACRTPCQRMGASRTTARRSWWPPLSWSLNWKKYSNIKFYPVLIIMYNCNDHEVLLCHLNRRYTLCRSRPG